MAANPTVGQAVPQQPSSSSSRPSVLPPHPGAHPHHHRLEELEVGLAAAHEVNAHLNAEVERLTLALEALVGERAAYQRHAKEVSKQLAAARGAAAAAQAASSVAVEQQQADGGEEAAGAGDAAAAGDAAGDQLAAAGAQQQAAAGDAGNWAAAVDWEALRAAGKEQGWLLDSRDVYLGEQIGQGTFGTVFRSVCRGGVVAVKCVAPRTADEGINFLREVEALATVRHPNVMALYGACVEPPERCWIVCEYLPGGPLSRWLYGDPAARRPPQRPLAERLRMALEVARGMEALEEHDPQVLHRDLKPSNVFLDAMGHAKVADFGLSRILTPSAMTCLTGETGSYLWMSPECVRHEVYNSRSDVWSWAVLCVELLTQQKPYSQYYATPVQLALQVAEGKLRPEVPPDCHPLLVGLLTAAFDPDPLNRPSFGLIVSQLSRVVEDVAMAAPAAQDSNPPWSRWFKKGGA